MSFKPLPAREGLPAHIISISVRNTNLVGAQRAVNRDLETMYPICISIASKILLALASVGLVAGDFSYPPPDGIQFAVGDTQIIRFETEWEEYSVALWQTQKEGESASLGPVLIGEYEASIPTSPLTRYRNARWRGEESIRVGRRDIQPRSRGLRNLLFLDFPRRQV